jgi:hypothetical protein
VNKLFKVKRALAYHLKAVSEKRVFAKALSHKRPYQSQSQTGTWENVLISIAHVKGRLFPWASD